MLRKLAHFNKRTSTEKTNFSNKMCLSTGKEDTSTTEDELDIDVTIGSGETEDSYSLDSSVLDESYLSSDEDSSLDSTEDSSDTE